MLLMLLSMRFATVCSDCALCSQVMKAEKREGLWYYFIHYPVRVMHEDLLVVMPACGQQLLLFAGMEQRL